jgi:acetolactate decarboxylase
MKSFLIPGLLLLATMCLSSIALLEDPPATTVVQQASVSSIGTMRATIRDGELAAKASIDDLNSQIPHLYAVGPLAMLAGEITVIDGEIITSEVTDAGPRVFTREGLGAPFLAYASVPQWAEPVVLPPVAELGALETEVERAARKAGLDTSAAFPVRIEATIDQAVIHIVNHRSMEALTPETHEAIKVFYELSGEPVEIVGFYSTVHQGVFVHHDRRSHLHLVARDRELAGHVDALSLREGALLYLSVWSSPAPSSPAALSDGAESASPR